MASNSSTKILIVCLVFLGTYLVAHLVKRDFDNSKDLLLENIPTFAVKNLKDGEDITEKTLYKGGTKLVLVHFWGTWCAPCEREFPALLRLIERFKDEKDIVFLMLAVNDTRIDALKFLKRFKFPDNVVLALDESGQSMKQFGTVKVPESYLFDQKGKSITKFVGPQNWELPYFFYQLSTNLKK